ncbi:CocE/NonD family hydrolase [Brevibacillus choshinensis]|uniref:CocE/NonD family hydrolase n=1 Tax=Brevibacillus choshinensis TaxID=54911 RepID=UPI002E1D25D8|nr:CocE/NonD family hydrolase [Brevibacillus choshinensis]MED4779714.1 CocE/NonD family hydrolase [Brevibacillus choshinensis]
MEPIIPNSETYKLYESGIHLADLYDTDKGWLQRRRTLEKDGWTELTEISSENQGYSLPLQSIAERLGEWNTTDWDAADDVVTSWGGHYQRYFQVSAHIEGEKKTAWVWALRDEKLPIDLIVLDQQIIAFLLSGRGESTVLVKPGFEEFTPLSEWNHSLLSKAEYGVTRLGRHDVTMRDGIKLATEVWLPRGMPEGSRVPTILVRTPYGRVTEHFGGSQWLRFVRRGYALVSQDTRGREDSEGEWLPCANEIEDGDDTLNWIAAQSWSDGKVGMIGGSYGGFVQWAAAASGNPHLQALVSYVTAGTPFVDLPRKGGTILSGTLAWAFAMADRKKDFEAAVRDDWDEVLAIRPLIDIPTKALGKEVQFWNEWMSHSDNDDFWARADWSLYGDKVNVPALLISGWYDDNGAGTTEAWEMCEKHERENVKLILGPWYHQANTTRSIHNVQFGNNAIRYDLDILQQRWFDRFLKGMDNAVEQGPRVQYYMVGENEWKTSENWPPQEVVYTPYYLLSGGQAQTSRGDGVLSAQEGFANQKPDSYQFDPQDAAPFLIDMSENECSVPENYYEVELREDVLVYSTPPLEEELVIAGDIYAVLYASSSARDTDWLVRLTDVDEEGNSIRLADGLIRARYRHSTHQPELLEPGKIECYEIKMSKIANTFKKGHRLRVSVTSGAKNLAFPNHNTGNDPATDTAFIVATQQVFHDAEYPSHVKLPVLQTRQNG